MGREWQEMYIMNANYTYNKQVGEISEKRTQQLKDAFREFPEYEQLVPPQVPMQTVILKKGATGLVVTPLQFLLMSNTSPAELGVDNIVSYLNKTNEILELSETTALRVTLEGLMDVPESSLELSLKPFTEESQILGAKGVGYRFMVIQENIKGDIRIEPFLKDTSKIYCNIILDIPKLINVNTTKEMLNELIDLAIAKTEAVASKIFLK